MQYDILNTEVTTIDGEKTTLEGYKGNVLLLVNVASKCGLTPQYEQLEALRKPGRKTVLPCWASRAISSWARSRAAKKRSKPFAAPPMA
jgi:hypothetical protein